MRQTYPLNGDDALMSEAESGMRLSMSEFQKYVRKKELWVNVKRTKIVRFRKNKRKDEEE